MKIEVTQSVITTATVDMGLTEPLNEEDLAEFVKEIKKALEAKPAETKVNFSVSGIPPTVNVPARTTPSVHAKDPR